MSKTCLGPHEPVTYGYLGCQWPTPIPPLLQVMEAILDKEEDIKAEMNVFNNHSHHPNIVGFLGAYLNKDQQVDDQLWIVMEVHNII